eukprot:1149172-Amphidinium_carterae.1
MPKDAACSVADLIVKLYGFHPQIACATQFPEQWSVKSTLTFSCVRARRYLCACCQGLAIPGFHMLSAIPTRPLPTVLLWMVGGREQ